MAHAGKTVQAIALIVAEPPTMRDAERALEQAKASQSRAALQPESHESRTQRTAEAAAGASLTPAPLSPSGVF